MYTEGEGCTESVIYLLSLNFFANIYKFNKFLQELVILGNYLSLGEQMSEIIEGYLIDLGNSSVLSVLAVLRKGAKKKVSTVKIKVGQNLAICAF